MRKCVLTALVWLVPVVALAQAAPPAPPPPELPTQEGNAEFAFVNTTGNAQSMTLGLSGGYSATTVDPQGERGVRAQ